MIEVKVWDGFPLFIDPRRVMSVKAHIESTDASPKCMINMQCETASEKWTLKDDAYRVRLAVQQATRITLRDEFAGQALSVIIRRDEAWNDARRDDGSSTRITRE
jgi:hypothetical protein